MYRRKTVSTFLHNLWEGGRVNLILLLDLAGDIKYLLTQFLSQLFNLWHIYIYIILYNIQCMGEYRRKQYLISTLHSSWKRVHVNLILLSNLAGM